MLEQLTASQQVGLVLIGALAVSPWVYGLANAAVARYKEYFERVIGVCGVEPAGPPPRILAEYDPERETYVLREDVPLPEHVPLRAPIADGGQERESDGFQYLSDLEDK